MVVERGDYEVKPSLCGESNCALAKSGAGFIVDKIDTYELS
jgi:hypothetical protein